MSKEALCALARYAAVFRTEGFRWGDWRSEPGVFPWLDAGPAAMAFVDDAYRYGWVISGFGWGEWAQGPDARRLRDDPAATATASTDDLGRLLTTCIRNDRFCEGALESAFESGLLTRIADRAVVLCSEEG